MHTTEQVIDAEIGHEQGEEGEEDVKMIDHRAAQVGPSVGVDDDGVDHKRDQGPRLLRIPTPIRAPRDIGPNGADEDADTERGEGGVKEEAGEQAQGIGLLCGALRMAPAKGEEDEGRQGTDERKAEQGVGHHNDGDVQAEQRRTEHGHDGRDAGIHQGRGG